MTSPQLAARGANDSLTHVDFMIGGAQMNVFGRRTDGAEVPVMRAGEWVAPAPT